MSFIEGDCSDINALHGWKRHLRQIEKNRKYARKKHVRKYGPVTLHGRIAKKQRISYVLKFFKKFYRGKPNGTSWRSRVAYLPPNFCFIEYPEESLQGIWESVHACMDERYIELVINHQQVKRYSLTSEALLGVGIDAGEQWRRINKHKVHIKGTMSADKDHQQLLSEIGIVKELKAKITNPLPYSTEKQHLFTYKSIKKSVPSPHSQDDKTIASEKLADHVNDCIKDHRLQLNKAANIAFMKSVSEVLDNAERHSSIDGNAGHIWFARGYLNSHSELQNFEVSIFNFGATMAETFQKLPSDNYSRQLVLEYANAHVGVLDEEQLITVAALQHRYSCKNTNASETNGQGTIVLIQFFEQLCDEFCKKVGKSHISPKMSIVSGRTHILFDGTYKLSQLPSYTATDEGDEQWIIAFNQQNSLKSPPDPKYVRKLDKTFFPGVAISIRFPLKEDDDE